MFKKIEFYILFLILNINKLFRASFVFDPPGTFSAQPKLTYCTSIDDYASDPYDQTKFYRCGNGYQYSFRCAPGTVYYGNGLCDYQRTSVSTASPSVPCLAGCLFYFINTVQQSTFCSYNNFVAKYPCCCYNVAPILPTVSPIYPTYPTKPTYPTYPTLPTTTSKFNYYTSTFSPLCNSGCPFQFYSPDQETMFCRSSNFNVVYYCCCINVATTTTTNSLPTITYTLPTTTATLSTTTPIPVTTTVPTTAILTTTTDNSLCASGCPYTFVDTTQQSKFCSTNDFSVIYPCCCGNFDMNFKIHIRKL